MLFSCRNLYYDNRNNKQNYKYSGKPIHLVMNKNSHQVLGGSTLSTYDITGQANVLSLAIREKLTLEDLAVADFFFSPSFDRQWNMVNLVAQKALGYYKIV